MMHIWDISTGQGRWTCSRWCGPSGSVRWSLALDLVLVVGVLTWIALRVPSADHPEAFAIYSALLVGAIVHRIFSVMDRPRPMSA